MFPGAADEINLLATKPFCVSRAKWLKPNASIPQSSETPHRPLAWMRKPRGHDMNSTAATTARLLAATALMFGAEQEQLCAGDAMRLCSSEIPDVDRVTACMIQKRASLSEGCKSVFHAPTPVSYQPASRPSKPVNLVPAKMR
jgi:hypothetical protein